MSDPHLSDRLIDDDKLEMEALKVISFQPSTPFEREQKYTKIEQLFERALKEYDLDEMMMRSYYLVDVFDRPIDLALHRCFWSDQDADRDRLFIQRILYMIHRLEIFDFNDLEQYRNQDSIYIQKLRQRIQKEWLMWESTQRKAYFESHTEAPYERLMETLRLEITKGVQRAYRKSVFPENIQRATFLHLVTMLSLDVVYETSEMHHSVGRSDHPIHSALVRFLNGREEQKRQEIEKYFSYFERDGGTPPSDAWKQATWEVLALINSKIALSENHISILQYSGALLESDTASYSRFAYLDELRSRLELKASPREEHREKTVDATYELLDHVLVPLSKLYPQRSSEIYAGFSEHRRLRERAEQSIFSKLQFHPLQ